MQQEIKKIVSKVIKLYQKQKSNKILHRKGDLQNIPKIKPLKYKGLEHVNFLKIMIKGIFYHDL